MDENFWWAVRGAIMSHLINLGIEHETISRIAEDAARDVKEAVEHEIRRHEHG